MYSIEVFLRLLDIAEVRFLRKILKSKILLRHFSRSHFASNFVFPTTLLFMYLVSLKCHFQTLTISPSLDACYPTSKCSYQLTLTLIMQNTIFHSVMQVCFGACSVFQLYLELEYKILKEDLGSSTTLIKFTKPLSYYRVLRLCKSKTGESI